jgi:hypothetical protein
MTILVTDCFGNEYKTQVEQVKKCWGKIKQTLEKYSWIDECQVRHNIA